mgnify:CR=1 FL=1
MKYLYYTINPRERLFKQLAGFLYYLRLADVKEYTLVLPKFELNNSYYYYEDLFDITKINTNINVISSDDYNKSMLGDTEFHLNAFNQLPITFPEYSKYRNQVYYNENYYKIYKQLKKYSFSISEENPSDSYIAVHWRQDDFLKIRPHVTFTSQELVDMCNKKIKEFNIKNVYISTDCTNQEDLDYIHSNLPTFKFPDINNFESVDLAIIESIICSSSEVFIGTSHSLYTSNIIGERNKLNIDQNKSIIFNKD